MPPRKCTCGSEYIRDGHNLPYDAYALAAHQELYLEISVSADFKPVAVELLLDFYRGVAEILPVKLIGDVWEEKYVVLPSDILKPKLSEDGFWHPSLEEYWDWHQGIFYYTLKHSPSLEMVHSLQKTTGAQLPNPSELSNPAMAAEMLKKQCIAYETEKLKQHTIDRNYETPLCVAQKMQPTEQADFELLLQVEGLGHATGAWTSNAEKLLLDNLVGIRELPAVREDVWNMIHAALMKQGISDSGLALQIMDQTRRGVYLRKGMPEHIESFLRSAALPDWLPDYLRKIRYLFPKGHIIAYLQLEMIYEWFRMNYPAEFKE